MPGADMEDDPLAGLDFEVEEPTDITNPADLTTYQIADRIADIDARLKELRQLIHDEPAKAGREGRELKSERGALVVEMNKRKDQQ